MTYDPPDPLIQFVSSPCRVSENTPVLKYWYNVFIQIDNKVLVAYQQLKYLQLFSESFHYVLWVLSRYFDPVFTPLAQENKDKQGQETKKQGLILGGNGKQDGTAKLYFQVICAFIDFSDGPRVAKSGHLAFDIPWDIEWWDYLNFPMFWRW